MSTTTTTPKAKAPKKSLAERQADFQARKAKAAIRAAYRSAVAEGAMTARVAFESDDRVQARRDHEDAIAFDAKLYTRESAAITARDKAEGKWSRVADAAGPQPKRTKDEKAAELAAILSSLDPETRAKFAALGVKAKAK